MELRLLGPVRVHDGADAVEPGPRQRRLVLALLALEVNRPVPRNRIVEWIWPDDPPRSAAHAVQVHVSHLRAVLGNMTIAAEGVSYMLHADPQRIDVHRFLDGVARAKAAPNDRALVALLHQALGLWTGPALADAASPEIRDRLCGGLEETRLVAMEDRFDALLRLGEDRELVGELTALVDAHPTRERLVGQLMLAQHRNGQTGKALDVARRTRAVLADELGIDPGAELQRLEVAILRNDKALEPSPPPGEPEPVSRTRLIGRDRDIADVVGRLADGARLLTLTGPGGVGKTRLAVEATRRLADVVPMVSLAPVRDPNLLLPTIASSLSIKDTGGAALRNALQVCLRERRLVLLLDNLEHLLDSVPDIAWLLDAAPGLTVVATSRSPLRLSGEHVRPVEPLDPPSAAALFTERARQAGALGELDSAVVEAICERVDRLPLAIELAAARTRLLSPPALLEQLGRSHDLLTDGARDWFERLHQEQGNLRAAMRWLLDRGRAEQCAVMLVFIPYWVVGGRLAEYRRTAQEVLAGPLSAGARAGVLAVYGFAVFGVDQAEGVRATREALALARETGDPTVLAPVLLMRGHVAMWVEDEEHAADMLAEAETLFRELGSTSHLALSRAARASILTSLGHPEEAAGMLVELEAERRSAGGWDLGVTMVYRGYVLLRLGDWDQAERVVRDAVALTHEFGSGTTMMYALHYLAVIAANTSRPHRAARLAGAAALLVERSGPSMLRAAVRQLMREATDKVNAELGAAEFDALFREGRTLTWRQAVALVAAP